LELFWPGFFTPTFDADFFNGPGFEVALDFGAEVFYLYTGCFEPLDVGLPAVVFAVLTL